eukprot:10309813-Alexandrium_andersonii.AAC.1
MHTSCLPLWFSLTEAHAHRVALAHHDDNNNGSSNSNRNACTHVPTQSQSHCSLTHYAAPKLMLTDARGHAITNCHTTGRHEFRWQWQSQPRS